MKSVESTDSSSHDVPDAGKTAEENSDVAMLLGEKPVTPEETRKQVISLLQSLLAKVENSSDAKRKEIVRAAL